MARLDRAALLDAFQGWGVPDTHFLVGLEYERHLLHADGRPLTYAEPGGIRALLEALVRRGWRPEHEGEHLVAAFAPEGSVTLEPGCQWEFSGRPHREAAAATAEAVWFARLTDELLAEVGSEARQIALGYTPFSPIHDIPFVPKGRYRQMRSYLIQVGDLSHHMMKGTAAIQASFDYADEADCGRKVRIANLLAPLNTAMFANSPYIEGKDSGYRSFRGHIWTRTDPARTGIRDDRAFSFEGWVDYLLDVPMMFIKTVDGYEASGGRTFRSWMEEGLNGVFPSWKDWDTHLTTVFPEVRVKRQIEVRGADCVSLPLAGSFAALWRGALYHPDPEQVLAFSSRFSEGATKDDLFERACRHGLEASSGDQTFAAWAAELIELVRPALPASDADLLEPLARQVATGRSVAATLLDELGPEPSRNDLLRATNYAGVT